MRDGENSNFALWLTAIRHIPPLEWSVGLLFLCFAVFSYSLHQIFLLYRLDLLHAFEYLKLKEKYFNRQNEDTAYFEISIPKNNQATAFQVHQKLLKSLHSTYYDPILGTNDFSLKYYFFQKWYRFRKVQHKPQTFFTLQIWSQYPLVSFRLIAPIAFSQLVEKAILNTYPAAEVAILDKKKVLQEIILHHQSYLAYGQSSIEGKFLTRINSFKDTASDPIDDIISIMRALPKGRFMACNILSSPASFYFNQVMRHLEMQQCPENFDGFPGISAQSEQIQSPLRWREPHDLSQAEIKNIKEKTKDPLFQVIISYWAVSTTSEDAKHKLSGIQAALTKAGEKNGSTLKHVHLFTKGVEILYNNGQLNKILDGKPVFKTKLKSNAFGLPYKYQNFGQIISDAELYSLWHLPHASKQNISSTKMVRFQKKPVDQQMREFKKNPYVAIGTSDLPMQENITVGIPTWEDMKKHTYILGGTGKYKSETLKIIFSSILSKRGKEKTALLIIDPKNDFATELLTMIPNERQIDVVYFNPSKQQNRPLSFPFFGQFPNMNKEEKMSFLISIIKHLAPINSDDPEKPELENILKNLLTTSYLLPQQSLSGLNQLLREPHQIKNILKFLPPKLQDFWLSLTLKNNSHEFPNCLSGKNNKLGEFPDIPEFMNIIDRQEAKITFEDMIKNGHIFIANLGSLDEQLKRYYLTYLTMHISQAIFGETKLYREDRKPCLFMMSEFQFLDSDLLETLFFKACDFNTALVLFHRLMGQLNDKTQKLIISNTATKIFMNTRSANDAKISQKVLGGGITSSDLINLSDGSAYIKTPVQGIPQEAMSINIYKTKHPTDIIRSTEDYYTEQTMQRYGTPIEVIEQKRNTINSIYYSNQHSKTFLELMAKQKTFMPITAQQQPAAKIKTLFKVFNSKFY